ncbi:hypothetical protein EYF80_036591 [Liparis tanakae]|uniref:Uncharacterized protein n=1 Tax=Liparis tanakae TaxID=230148 RepID=A0A4Z2GIP8_9TELE|nr:hypothetical protein EYF80_036591 [Liparis tanakae]
MTSETEQHRSFAVKRNNGHQRTCEVEAAAALQKQTLLAQLPVTSPPPVPPGSGGAARFTGAEPDPLV